jgi:hypothetical protein
VAGADEAAVEKIAALVETDLDGRSRHPAENDLAVTTDRLDEKSTSVRL